jgi:hypothetical protein
MSANALKSLFAAAVLLLGAQTASASTGTLRAEAYFDAISGGNVATVASFYADEAEIYWIGGPLSGVYTGKGQITDLWQKFSDAAGEIYHKVLEVSESKYGSRSTVTARVSFIGPKEVPVKFLLVFEDGKIINQIWQVDKPAGYLPPQAVQETPAADNRPPENADASDRKASETEIQAAFSETQDAKRGVSVDPVATASARKEIVQPKSKKKVSSRIIKRKKYSKTVRRNYRTRRSSHYAHRSCGGYGY